ncbi:MAG: hypothetical protein ABFC80_04605 [Coriobacteriales bacterium]|nr:hypothetical protein [Actinomycetes bacterium]
MSDSTGTIEITTKHMKGSVAQEAFNPIIEIDGEPHVAQWGANTFTVAPGHHTLKAYHRWLMFPQAYASSTDVDVAAGETVRLEWRTGGAVFSHGKWSMLPAES